MTKCLLKINDYHFTQDKARDKAIEVLKGIGLECPDTGWDLSKYTLKTTQYGTTPENYRKTTIVYEELIFEDIVKALREKGVFDVVQSNIDKQDSYFAGSLPIATNTKAIVITSEFAGHKKELRGPCRFYPVEDELMEDILYYRKEACLRSDESTFILTSRFFRAYLSACISIVDAFINKHILIKEYENFTSVEFEQLKSVTNIEHKIDLWLKIFTQQDISFLKNGKPEWTHFMEIRKERNNMIHVSEANFGHEIKAISKYLNYVQAGIGGLLKLFRELQGKTTLTFIERLCTAPTVEFVEN